MSPRSYRMGSRADSVAATRAGIVSAAMALHAEKGVLRTNWEDIAERAGVSPATVYRHYSTLVELVPVCARTVFDVIQPPTVEEAGAQFASLPSGADRLDLLVAKSSHCYHAGEGWLHAAYRERDFVPALDDALQVIEGTLDSLVQAAAGRRLKQADHDLLFVLCNFPMWWALRERGFSARAAQQLIVRMVHEEATRIGLDREEP